MIKGRRIAAVRRALGLLALIGITIFSPAALAQTSGSITLELFAPDGVDPKPEAVRRLVDAIRKTRRPAACPLGQLTIFTPVGDPLFQDAVARTRHEVMLTALKRHGIDVSRLDIRSLVFGGSGPGNDAQYEAARDDKLPRLTTTSAPRKGTKVKAGDEIKVTMVARDDADPVHWQTGIKTVQLVVDNEGGAFVASENYEPCSDPKEKRVEATYTVPTDPPPIVRLSALAEDHAGLMEIDVGDFPTQDLGALWTGTVHWTAKHTPTHLVTSTAKVRLREVRLSDGAIDLVHEGSVVTVTHSMLGGDDCTSAGQGTSPAAGRAGFFEREQKVGASGELRWGAWSYELRIKPDREPIWTQTCPDVAWPGTDRTTTITYGGNAGSMWQAAIGDANRDPSAPRPLEEGRMIGNYTAREKDSWEDTVSWSICREGVACPPPSQAAAK